MTGKIIARKQITPEICEPRNDARRNSAPRNRALSDGIRCTISNVPVFDRGRVAGTVRRVHGHMSEYGEMS